MLLAALLLLFVIVALSQRVWAPLRAPAQRYGPLCAGAIGLVCLCDLVTAKTAWLPLPYFPGPDEVLGAMIDERAQLFEHTWHSLRLLLCGYVAGVAAGSQICGLSGPSILQISSYWDRSKPIAIDLAPGREVTPAVSWSSLVTVKDSRLFVVNEWSILML